MTTYHRQQSQFPGVDWATSVIGVAGEYGVWFSAIGVTQFVNLRGDSTHPQFLNGVQRVIGVELPASVQIEISETEPGIQGDRVSGARKPATLETGLVIQVPLFVEQNEVVKVDTRTGEYLGRV